MHIWQRNWTRRLQRWPWLSSVCVYMKVHGFLRSLSNDSLHSLNGILNSSAWLTGDGGCTTAPGYAGLACRFSSFLIIPSSWNEKTTFFMQTQHFQRDQCKARHRYDISSICHLGWIVFRQLGSGEYADELPLAVTIKSPAGESCRRHKEMAKTTRAKATCENLQDKYASNEKRKYHITKGWCTEVTPRSAAWAAAKTLGVTQCSAHILRGTSTN